MSSDKKVSCPFKFDKKQLPNPNDVLVEENSKQGWTVKYPIICNLTKYEIECVGEEICPIVNFRKV
jgi:hypothetical protein